MRGTIAVVEDDPTLRRTLQRGLESEGFEVVWAAGTATEAVAMAEPDPRAPDAVVLDLRLPDGDGLDLLAALRSRGVTCPAVALSGRAALQDRLKGFGAGLDDYLAKPFSLSELAARLDVLVRRNVREVPAAGGLRLDPQTHEVQCGTRVASLSPLEFRLLGALLSRHGAVVRRATLVASGWPAGAIVNENTIDSYMTRLRRVLGSVESPQRLHTVRGVGYLLK